MYKAYVGTLAGGCGFNTISSFAKALTPEEIKAKMRDRWWWDGGGQRIEKAVLTAGTGITCGSFRDTPECKGVYEEMCALYPILYQSDIRKNKRHPTKAHTGAFMCVWDTNKKPKATKPAPITIAEVLTAPGLGNEWINP